MIPYKEIIGRVSSIEPFAVNASIDVLDDLRARYGRGRWRKLKGRATVRLMNDAIRTAEVHWYEANGIGRREIKIMKKNHKFVVCVQNEDYGVSLELRKLYEVLPDDDAASEGYLRIVDESGEDYLYPENWFAPIELPQAVEDALLAAA